MTKDYTLGQLQAMTQIELVEEVDKLRIELEYLKIDKTILYCNRCNRMVKSHKQAD